jgi:hypothetical protein
MAALTFLETLKREVGRMQAAHPEREGALARAHALIMHGMVLPSADDPATGSILSSDGEKRYTVNGVCDCQAGQHGKPCKHMQSWRLYQYIARKVEAQATPEDVSVDTKTLPLPEAPASINLKVLIGGHETQITLRDSSETRLLDRLHTLLKRQDLRPLPKPAPRTGNWKPRGR